MNRGAKPGERRGGRKKGTPNRQTKEVKEIAQFYTEEALGVLDQIMSDEEQPSVTRISAAKELLDRGWGKPAQAIAPQENTEPLTIILDQVEAKL